MKNLDCFYTIDDSPKRDSYNKPNELSAPIRREMNNDDSDDFIALDFETCTPLRTSAISIGMVKVIDGEIVQQYYSVINPIRDKYTSKEPNLPIHGISLKTAEKAETFGELFESVRSFIGDLPLVCHNKSVDIGIMEQLMGYYNVAGIRTNNAICTYELTGLSLEKCCDKYGISLGNHHNALSDAEACARIYLEIIDKPFIDRGGAFVFNKKAFTNRDVSSEHRKQLSDSEIENKDTVFYGARIVITGVFEEYPERDGLAAILQSLGAKINSSISSKTNIVIVGSSAGPKKIQQIQEYNESGAKIYMMKESELTSILKQL